VRAELGSTGFPLGFQPESTFPASSPLHLEPGEVVLFVTDGLVEARSPSRKCFGYDRALDVARANRERSAREIVKAMYEGVCQFCGDKPPQDDVTVIVIKVQEAVSAKDP
jgi:sigma-B regulation protein RsbU (phosphoserine phosphatase)